MIDGNDYDHHSFRGQSFPITDNNLFDIANSEAVNHHIRSRNGFFGNSKTVFSQFGDLAVVQKENVFSRDAHFNSGDGID